MRSKKLLGSRLIASALAAAAAIAPASIALTACYGEEAYVAYESPPAPRYEYYSYRPGYLWVGGYWARGGGRWSWQGGHYVRERAGFVYEHPRWEHRGDRHVFIHGGWRQG
jgi:hypothetical protein